jgi:hypothetical protein
VLKNPTIAQFRPTNNVSNASRDRSAVGKKQRPVPDSEIDRPFPTVTSDHMTYLVDRALHILGFLAKTLAQCGGNKFWLASDSLSDSLDNFRN